LQLRREAEERREREWIAKREGLAGEIRGAFGNLAGEIVGCEDRLSTLEEGIRRQETDKQAAALALDIFKEVGNGADLLLAGLSREMESMLGNILPAGRAVSLLGLDKEQIQVQDAAGGARALEHLSTGTKHAMVLAAKLALALKHRQGGPGILVLDEPFLAMDDERETKALELLRDFHDRHGWQIILMTKETGLKNKVLKLFTAPKLVDLSLFR
jgi:recombinational DNA repair ATPase RecF